jgi:hypothetical protein
MMKNELFEYRKLVFSPTGNISSPLVEQMNQLGRDGWRAVAGTYHANGGNVESILMERTEEGST